MWEKPNLFVSQCLGFENCRWNGDVIKVDAIEKLRPLCNIYTTCPEKDIGLGVPRKPIRIVRVGDDDRLLQPGTGEDVTEKMQGFSEDYLSGLPEMDGFILKFKSPSCGTDNIKIYPEEGSFPIKGVRPGFFGTAVKQKYKISPIIDEGRLTNYLLREAFLTHLFANARLRTVQKTDDLIKVHESLKMTLMAYDPNKRNELGRIVALKKELAEMLMEYRLGLMDVFRHEAPKKHVINALEKSFGFLSDDLNKEERQHFKDTIEMYQEDRIPLGAILTLMRSWIARFDCAYLKGQTFFEPYPKELLSVRDSGKDCRK